MTGRYLDDEFHARQPHLIDHGGTTLHGLDRPSLPQNSNQMDSDIQREAQALYLQQALCALYRKALFHRCREVYDCFVFQQTAAFQLLLLARNLLIDGEPGFVDEAMVLEKVWDLRPQNLGMPFPVSFSDEEKKAIAADMQATGLGIYLMQEMRESLDQLFPTRGFVPHKH